MIKSDLIRIYKSRAIRIGMAVALIVGMIVGLMMRDEIKTYDAPAWFPKISIFWILIAVFISGMVIIAENTVEYMDRTINNRISAGFGRFRVYISLLLKNILIALILSIVIFIPTLIQFTKWKKEYLLFCIVQMVMLIIITVVFASAISLVVTKTALSVVCFILAGIIILFTSEDLNVGSLIGLDMNYSQKLEEGDYITETFNTGNKMFDRIEVFSGFKYEGVKRQLLKLGLYIHPVNAIMKMVGYTESYMSDYMRDKNGNADFWSDRLGSEEYRKRMAELGVDIDGEEFKAYVAASMKAENARVKLRDAITGDYRIIPFYGLLDLAIIFAVGWCLFRKKELS